MIRLHNVQAGYCVSPDMLLLVDKSSLLELCQGLYGDVGVSVLLFCRASAALEGVAMS